MYGQDEHTLSGVLSDTNSDVQTVSVLLLFNTVCLSATSTDWLAVVLQVSSDWRWHTQQVFHLVSAQ